MGKIKTVKALSIRQMRRIDRNAVKNGIKIELMMENAGKALVLFLKGKFGDLCGKNVVCVTGKGNNGGGVIASIRHLRYYGANATLLLVFPKRTLSKPAKFHLSLLDTKTRVIEYGSKNCKKFFAKIQNADIIIDGIFGTGFCGKIDDSVTSIISNINRSKSYILSNDIPSGIDADTGHINTIAVKANFTVVLHRPKKWMHEMDLPPSKYSIESIGIPSKF